MTERGYITRQRYWIKRHWVNANIGRRRNASVSNVEMQREIRYMSAMELAQLDSLLNWKLDRYLAACHMAKEGTKMQDQITIEMRVDFADKDKIPELVNIACSMARTLVANVQLLGPACTPECVVYTDNFMSPAQKINIYDNLIAKGNEELDKVTGASATAAVSDVGVSDELLAAMKG
jgi:hypothetical protein